jgi:hypothetical protein
MSVIVALFGEDNFAWPICKAQNEIVTMMDLPLFQFWECGDREGFIDFAVQSGRTARGNKVPVFTASRWFNLGTRIANSAGDLWVHREGDQLWWTTSGSQPFYSTLEGPNPPIRREPFVMLRKSVEPWANKDRNGRPLTFSSLHPKAKAILNTQSTQVTPRNEGGALWRP